MGTNLLKMNKMKKMIVAFERTRNKPNNISSLGEEVVVVDHR